MFFLSVVHNVTLLNTLQCEGHIFILDFNLVEDIHNAQIHVNELSFCNVFILLYHLNLNQNHDYKHGNIGHMPVVHPGYSHTHSHLGSF